MASRQKLKVSSRPKVVGVRSRRSMILAGVGLLALMVLAIQSALLWDLRQQQRQQIEEGVSVKMLLARAVDGLLRDAVIEGRANQVYFPENRLTMQAGLHSPRLQYVPNDDGLQLAQKNIINARVSAMMSGGTTEEVYERVPQLQACTRQFQIQFVEMAASRLKTEKLDKVAVRPLADGRTAYVYQDRGCSDAGELVRPMLDSLQSY